MKILASRVFKSQTIALRTVLSSVIGLVLLSEDSHSLGLGIGYILASLHAKGMSLRRKQLLINFFKQSVILGPKCLIISFEMPEGPAAFPSGNAEIIIAHSSLVIGFIKEL